MTGSVDIGPSCLVVGGAGFTGRAIVRALLERGLKVRALDRLRAFEDEDRVEFVVADIRDGAKVRRAARGCDTVFHTAAVMNFLGLYDETVRRECYDINVGGTWNVIDGCREHGVERLVYTSTDSVVYDPGPVVDADETRPYTTRFLDIYAETKVAAEKAVLGVDGKGLRTVAIRPAGIWGPGPGCYMIEKFVEELARGKLVARIGGGDALADNTHVRNLVSAELLAAEKLVTDPDLVGGRAYFVTDEEPMNIFEFFRPLVEALGFKMPRLRLPAWPLYRAAHAMEIVHRLGGPSPAMTRLEVHNMTTSFTFSCARARRELGYEPLVGRDGGMGECVEYCRELLARHGGASA